VFCLGDACGLRQLHASSVIQIEEICLMHSILAVHSASACTAQEKAHRMDEKRGVAFTGKAGVSQPKLASQGNSDEVVTSRP